MAEVSSPIETLQPGMIIAPQISIRTAEQLVERLYQLHVKSIKQLNSYDDKNYHVVVHTQTDNPYIQQVYPHGYVLKVLNTLDTPKHHVEAEHEMAKLLSKEGIACPLPEINIFGKETSIEKLPVEKDGEYKEISESSEFSIHLVRLMKFIPGVRLVDVPFTPEILIQAGDLCGRIDKILKNFHHEALTIHDTIWSLSSTPRLMEFIHAVTNETHKKYCIEIIDAFNKEIVPILDKFQKGVIHGDFNEQNVIVNKTEGNNNQICGIIDFGDANESCVVFEIALCIMYMQLESTVVDILKVGGYVLKGYLTHITLNNQEKDALKTLVCSRYAQSLVMGAYSYMQDPGNEYLLSSAKRGWGQIMQVWDTPKETLYANWQQVIDNLD